MLLCYKRHVLEMQLTKKLWAMQKLVEKNTHKKEQHHTIETISHANNLSVETFDGFDNHVYTSNDVME